MLPVRGSQGSVFETGRSAVGRTSWQKALTNFLVSVLVLVCVLGACTLPGTGERGRRQALTHIFFYFTQPRPRPDRSLDPLALELFASVVVVVVAAAAASIVVVVAATTTTAAARRATRRLFHLPYASLTPSRRCAKPFYAYKAATALLSIFFFYHFSPSGIVHRCTRHCFGCACAVVTFRRNPPRGNSLFSSHTLVSVSDSAEPASGEYGAHAYRFTSSR